MKTTKNATINSFALRCFFSSPGEYISAPSHKGDNKVEIWAIFLCHEAYGFNTPRRLFAPRHSGLSVIKPVVRGKSFAQRIATEP